MRLTQTITEADRAAQAFYGQPADTFAKQIAHICRNDPRLIAAFEQTRAAYQQAETAQTKLQS